MHAYLILPRAVIARRVGRYDDFSLDGIYSKGAPSGIADVAEGLDDFSRSLTKSGASGTPSPQPSPWGEGGALEARG